VGLGMTAAEWTVGGERKPALTLFKPPTAVEGKGELRTGQSDEQAACGARPWKAASARG
jgi:hypothetical protein